MAELYLNDVMISLIHSIDIVNYLLKNHHKRVAIISYNIGKEMNLSEESLTRLVVAASLHDIGALYVKERDKLIELDISNALEHAVRGKMLLNALDFFVPTSNIILHHHRKWNGGNGSQFENHPVPLESFILHLADRIEILYNTEEYYFNQNELILEEILKRRESIFHPDVVDAFLSLSIKESFWLSITDMELVDVLRRVIGSNHTFKIDLILLEKITIIFANIVDYRLRFTATHSTGVGEVAYALARKHGLPLITCKKLRLAGYLHDIGKIGIPTEIIDKPGQLTDEESRIMKSHVYFTNKILKDIQGMDDICLWASMHHEKRDGSGYPFHKDEEAFSDEVDILILADIFTAVSENRAYRKDFSRREIRNLIDE